MPIHFQRESDNTYVLRIRGTLLKSELGSAQDAAAIDIDAGVTPRVLTILEDFEGFERDARWGELTFLSRHGSDIARIAILGERRWEGEAMAFAGAGFRRAPVKFFPADQEAQAHAWLKE